MALRANFVWLVQAKPFPPTEKHRPTLKPVNGCAVLRCAPALRVTGFRLRAVLKVSAPRECQSFRLTKGMDGKGPYPRGHASDLKGGDL